MSLTVTADTAVQVQDLAKTYPQATEPAVNGIDVEVKTGEVFGFLGPNGAGKTTSISIMCTLLRPDRGTVTVCGEDAVRHPSRIKPIIGLVPQEIALYPMLTVHENLIYFGKLYGIAGAKLNERVDEALELMGLTDNASKRVAACSGGIKRRANLAAGILHRPKVLFLDEPTVGIDAQSRSMILDNLLRLRERGITMVYTSHYMEEVQRICDRISIIDHGKIICSGKPNELVANEDGCENLEELFLKLTGRQLRD